MGINFQICRIISLICGSLLIIGSIVLLAGGYDALFNWILHLKYQVKEGTEVYDIWKDTPVPLQIRFYFFNIDNPEDFLAGAKPILTEKGPYIYNEFRQKENITFHSNSTVTFLQNRMWIYDEDNPDGRDINEVITVLNCVPISAAYSIRDSPFMRTTLNSFFNQMEELPIINVTVRDFLFDGVEDPLLDFMANQVVAENGTFHYIEDGLDLPPGLTDYDKFGWFYKRNLSNTYDGIYNMFTGEDSIDNVGGIDLWDYSKTTEFYDYPCNMVNGSAGELWPPEQKRTQIEFYSSDLCMTVKLFYKEDMTDSYGIDGYRFWGSKDTFTNQSVNPDNECFCVEDRCSPTGLLNAETCRMGSPAFISFPHYLNADPYLLDQVVGLSPNEKKHSFFIDIEPNMGIPIQVAARMQINMRITNFHDFPGRIDIYKDIPDMILPVLWFEEMSMMTQELADEIKPALFFENSFVIPLLFSLMLIAGLLTVSYTTYKLISINKEKKRKFSLIKIEERTEIGEKLEKLSISSSNSSIFN